MAQCLPTDTYLPTHIVQVALNVAGSAESVAWRQHFIERGGLRHLFDIFASGNDDGCWVGTLSTA